MNAVISVGAGRNQLPLIQALAERGMPVYGFDLDPNAPGKRWCAEYRAISSWDYEQAIEWLAGSGQPFSAVGCFSYGSALKTQQEIAKRFDLPGVLPDDVFALNEGKGVMRALLASRGLSALQEWNGLTDAEAERLPDGEYLVKPRIGGSSAGVARCGKQELQRRVREEPGLIVQEYLDGPEYRIIAVIQKGRIAFLALLHRENLAGTFLIGRLQPVREDAWARAYAERLLQGFPVKDALLKADVIKQGDRVETIEIDFGIAGDHFETHLASACYGLDYMEQYIRFIQGLPWEEQPGAGSHAFLDFAYWEQPGTLSYDSLDEQLQRIVGDHLLIRRKQEGERVRMPASNMDSPFAVLHNRAGLTHAEFLRQLCGKQG